MNKCIFMGRLTRDPEIRYANNEKQTEIANFSIAVDRIRAKEDEPSADFFRCVTFGSLAEFAEHYLSKGKRIVVVGRMQNDSYENKDGQRVNTTQLVASEIHFADAKNDSNTEEKPKKAGNVGKPKGTKPGTGSAKQKQADDRYMDIPDGIDEELPFN